LHPKNEVRPSSFIFGLLQNALVAELVDALDSKSSDCKIVWVRFPPKVQQTKKMVNRKRAPKRKLAFFLERSEAIIFLVFKRSLKGTLMQSMNPT
jgi:hypothetical protein